MKNEINIEKHVNTMQKKLKKVQNLKNISTLTAREKKNVINENLKSLRKENVELKKLFSQIKSKKKKSKEKIEKLSNLVYNYRLQYDKIKSESIKLHDEIEKKKNIHRDLKVLRDNKREKEKIRISKLEEQLDRVMIKFNDENRIKKLQIEVETKYKEERAKFDSKSKSIEKYLKQKTNDFEEIRNIFFQAKSLKQQAKNELIELKKDLQELIITKEKEISRKTQFVKEKLEITKKYSQRKDQRSNMLGKNNIEVIVGMVGKRILEHRNDKDILKEKNELEVVLEKWKKIKDITVASNEHEVISNYHYFLNNQKQLKEIVERMRKQILSMNQKIDRLLEIKKKTKMDESNNFYVKKRSFDFYNEQLNTAKKSLLEEKTKSDYLLKVCSAFFISITTLNQSCLSFLNKNPKVEKKIPRKRYDFRKTNSFIGNENIILNALDSFSNNIKHVNKIQKDKMSIENETTYPSSNNNELYSPQKYKVMKVSEGNLRIKIANVNRNSNESPIFDNRRIFKRAKEDQSPEDKVEIYDREQIKKMSKLAVSRSVKLSNQKNEK